VQFPTVTPTVYVTEFVIVTSGFAIVASLRPVIGVHKYEIFAGPFPVINTSSKSHFLSVTSISVFSYKNRTYKFALFSYVAGMLMTIGENIISLPEFEV